MDQPYSPDDDARVSAGPPHAYRRGSASPTKEELAAEDARARELIRTAREDLPATWRGDIEDDE